MNQQQQQKVREEVEENSCKSIGILFIDTRLINCELC